MDLNTAADEVQMWKGRHGLVDVASFSRFWCEQSISSQAATNVISALLALYMGMETGEEKNCTVADMLQRVGQAPPSTRIASALGVEVGDGVLCSAFFLGLFREFDPGNATLRAAVGKMQTLRASGSTSRTFVDDVVKSLSTTPTDSTLVNFVEQCSNIEIDENPSVFLKDVKYLAPAMLHPYLMHQLLHRKKTQIIFETVLKLLQHPLISEPMVLALLHMLRSFFRLAPNIPQALLEQTLVQVKAYFLWPKPYGVVAQDILQMVSLECKAPGHAMRQMHIEELPDLVEGSTSTGKERQVHILIDTSCTLARMLRDTLLADRQTDLSLRMVQQALLNNILGRVLNEECDAQLQHCPSAVVSKLYYEAVEVLEQSILMTDREGLQYRQEHMQRIRAAVAAAATPDRSYGPSPLDAPPLQFSFHAVTVDNTMPSPGTEARYGKDRFPTRRAAQNAIQNILQQYVPFATATKRQRVKIGLMGGDACIHLISCALTMLQWTKPKLFENLDVQFYVVPADECVFGSYLARYDGWYARHVMHGPQCVIQMWPRCKASAAAEPSRDRRGTADPPPLRHDGGAGVMMTPSVLLRSLLESYFRDARERLHVNLYRCECWREDSSAQQCDVVIPFFSRVEIGQKAVNYARSMDESTLGKSAKYSGVTATVRYTAMNPFAFTRTGEPLPKTTWHSVSVSNHWRHGETLSTDPTAPWLELSLIDADARKKKREAQQCHASVVEIEAESVKKRFDVLIDGVYYGQLYRVRVSKLDSSGDTCALPIMTFFPIVGES